MAARDGLRSRWYYTVEVRLLSLALMKIKRDENSIELVPETDFEKECLMCLQKHPIKSVQWEDSWERKGNLIFTLKTDLWE